MSPRSGGAGAQKGVEQKCSRRPGWSSPRLTLQPPGSPVRAAEGRRGGCSLQCRWVPASRGRPVPPSLLPARPASRRASKRAGGARARWAPPGGCAARGRVTPRAPAAPPPAHLAAPTTSRIYLGPACVHVTRLVVRTESALGYCLPSRCRLLQEAF